MRCQGKGRIKGGGEEKRERLYEKEKKQGERPTLHFLLLSRFSTYHQSGGRRERGTMREKKGEERGELASWIRLLSTLIPISLKC